MNYKVGTRGSELALRQTEYVIKKLKSRFTDDEFETVVIKTTGDKDVRSNIPELGGKGVFTDKIEEALINGEIDFAVHSMKDMPDKIPDGLVFARAWERADARDVMIYKNVGKFEELPKGAKIGTGSIRRKVQLLAMREDLEIVPIRGNVDSRIKKLEDLDGIVLAAAGIKRIGRETEISEYLSPKDFVPAPAQGILAVELREDKSELLEKINSFSDPRTEKQLEFERGFMKAVGGDCRKPTGAYLEEDGAQTKVYVIFGDEDGSNIVRTSLSFSTSASVEEIIQKTLYDIKISKLRQL